MARQGRSKQKLILFLSLSLTVVFLFSSVSVAAEDSEEIILRGEDRRPTQSSFEYKQGDTTTNERSMPSTEIPSARYEGKSPEPSLRKEPRFKRQEDQKPRETKLKQGNSVWKWPAIIGGIGLLIVIAS